MSESFYRLIYTLLPCLVGAYAVALFLTTRSISTTRAWMLGMLIAAVLTVGATMVVTTGVAMDRSNFFLVLVAVFLASAWLARSYAARFELVQAVQ